MSEFSEYRLDTLFPSTTLDRDLVCEAPDKTAHEMIKAAGDILRITADGWPRPARVAHQFAEDAPIDREFIVLCGEYGDGEIGQGLYDPDGANRYLRALLAAGLGSLALTPEAEIASLGEKDEEEAIRRVNQAIKSVLRRVEGTISPFGLMASLIAAGCQAALHAGLTPLQVLHALLVHAPHILENFEVVPSRKTKADRLKSWNKAISVAHAERKRQEGIIRKGQTYLDRETAKLRKKQASPRSGRKLRKKQASPRSGRKPRNITSKSPVQ